MDVKTSLFICCTPYQVFNSINYSQYLDGEKEIIILGQFKDARNLTERLKQSDFFSNVYYTEKADVEKNKLRPFIGMLRVTFPQKTIKYFLPDFDLKHKKYDLLVSSSYFTDLTVAFCNYLKKYGTKVYTLEDGTSAYVEEGMRISKIHQIYGKIFRKGIPGISQERFMVYQPEICNNKEVPKIYKIPKIIRDDVCKQRWNYIFSDEEIKNIPEPIILFSGGMNSAGENVCYKAELTTLKLLEKMVGIDNFVFKLHPKLEEKNYSKDINIYKQRMPWEIYCLNYEIKNKILISFYSTAAMTPKIIFDEEPIVIYLFKCFDIPWDMRDKFEEFIDRFKGCYRNKERIIVPHDVAEFEQIVEIMKNGGKYEHD